MYTQACSIVPYYVKCVRRALLSFVWFDTHKAAAKLNICTVHNFQIPLLKSNAVAINVGYYVHDVLNNLFFTCKLKNYLIRAMVQILTASVVHCILCHICFSVKYLHKNETWLSRYCSLLFPTSVLQLGSDTVYNSHLHT